MAKDIRKELEQIAVDMVMNDMQYIGEDLSTVWDEVATLTDEELISFICD